MQSIQDSLLTGYAVDGTNRTIVLHTGPRPGCSNSLIDVLFDGVAAYHFEGDCFDNIVVDIEEVSAASVIGDGTIFAERARLYGWPPGWNSQKESAVDFFSRMGSRLFELHCSYGMYGWVAAAKMQKVVLHERT